jgi:hypothetical protein
MFEEIKKKCAHFYIKRKISKKHNEAISFNKVVADSREVFIVMPTSDNDFPNSLEILRYLQIHKKVITLFLPEFRYNQIPDKERYKFISFHPDQITKFFLPNKKLRNKIEGKTFDIVLDLNRFEDTFHSAISNFVTSKVRLGFRKNRSEGYYNLLFDSKQTESGAAYFNLLNYLRMF